jgi:hypothetical protein
LGFLFAETADELTRYYKMHEKLGEKEGHERQKRSGLNIENGAPKGRGVFSTESANT